MHHRTAYYTYILLNGLITAYINWKLHMMFIQQTNSVLMNICVIWIQLMLEVLLTFMLQLQMTLDMNT